MTTEAIRSSGIYRASLRRVSDVSDAASDASFSSIASVPDYGTFRRSQYIAHFLLSPLVLILCALGAWLIWTPYWMEAALGLLGLLAAEAIRQPLAKLSLRDNSLRLPVRGQSRLPAIRVLPPLLLSAFIVEGIRLFLIAISVTLAGGDVTDERPWMRAIWLGLGAATAETVLRSEELTRQVSLYADVLVDGKGALSLDDGDDHTVTPDELDLEQTYDIVEAHLRARERAAIVETYGVDLPRIPNLLLVMWTANSILLATSCSVLLYLGYLSPSPNNALELPTSATWIVVSILHGVLSSLWLVLLPVSGLALVSFASFILLFLLNLVALALFGVLR